MAEQIPWWRNRAPKTESQPGYVAPIASKEPPSTAPSDKEGGYMLPSPLEAQPLSAEERQRAASWRRDMGLEDLWGPGDDHERADHERLYREAKTHRESQRAASIKAHNEFAYQSAKKDMEAVIKNYRTVKANLPRDLQAGLKALGDAEKAIDTVKWRLYWAKKREGEGRKFHPGDLETEETLMRVKDEMEEKRGQYYAKLRAYQEAQAKSTNPADRRVLAEQETELKLDHEELEIDWKEFQARLKRYQQIHKKSGTPIELWTEEQLSKEP